MHVELKFNQWCCKGSLIILSKTSSPNFIQFSGTQFLVRHRQEQTWATPSYQLSSLADILAKQFVQRWDIYPKQLADGRWITVHKPLQFGLLTAHLKGTETLGTYLLDAKSQGHFMVLDADHENAWNWLVCIAKALYLAGTVTYLESSRRGGHLWLFFPKKMGGHDIRQFGRGLLSTFGIHNNMVEMFPKQDKLHHGPGSLIRLPLGIHKKSHKRYGFQYPTGQPLAPTLREQLQQLAQPAVVEQKIVDHFQERGHKLALKERKRRLSKSVGHIEYNSDIAQLAAIIKASVTVYDFVSQYVELSPSGRGLCPFHDDHQPSFNVNLEENYWYCFACEMGGSIIHFWMHWRGCDYKTAGAIQDVESIAIQ